MIIDPDNHLSRVTNQQKKKTNQIDSSEKTRKVYGLANCHSGRTWSFREQSQSEPAPGFRHGHVRGNLFGDSLDWTPPLPAN
jgi:hypothetical protein